MKRRLQMLFYSTVLPYAGLMIVKIFSATYRLRLVDLHNENRTLARDGSIIYASWHQQFFPGITFFSTRKPIAILISQSRDGELMARVVNILGWQAVRGSSSKGGSEGLQQLKQLAQSGCKIGHIVDGPKGPFGVINPGLLRIAQVSGMAIIPTITSSERHWMFKSWDRFMVPKPFSRVLIRFGEPVVIPSDLDESAFEEQRLFIERWMQGLYEDTDRIWFDRDRIEKIFHQG